MSSEFVLGMIGQGPDHPDRPLRAPEAAALGVEHACPRAAGPDVDPDHQPVHFGCLPRLSSALTSSCRARITVGGDDQLVGIVAHQPESGTTASITGFMAV